MGSLEITRSLRISSPQLTNKAFTKQNKKLISVDLQEYRRMQCKSKLHETCSEFRVTNGLCYSSTLRQLCTPFRLYSFATKSPVQSYHFGWRQL